jgi:SAM-dependent methyltransferase
MGYDRLHGLPGHFPVVQCLQCGGAYLAERPLDLAAYYPAETYAAYDGDAKHFSRAPGRGQGLAQRRQWLMTLKPGGGRLLDVGCGSGDFLDLLRRVPGWRVAGLEPSPAAVEHARAVRALDVTMGELPQSHWPPASYDSIMMWHVLEHVPNPALVLAEVRRLLRPGGVFVLAVPVADSAEARCFGPAWAGYDVPRHLMTFTRSNVAQLLTQAGFRVEEHFGVIQGFASLRLSLRWWLAEKGVRAVSLQALITALALPPVFAYVRGRDGKRVSVATMAAHLQGD